MAGRRAVHAVDTFRGDLHCRRKPEGDVRAPDVVVDRLGQTDDPAPLGGEQRGRLVRPRSAQRHETVQPQLFVRLFHFVQLGAIVAVGDGHLLKGLALAAEHSSSREEKRLEILFRKNLVLVFDQSRIAVEETENFHVLYMGTDVFGKRAHYGVKPGAIPAAGQHSYFHNLSPMYQYALLSYFLYRGANRRAPVSRYFTTLYPSCP